MRGKSSARSSRQTGNSTSRSQSGRPLVTPSRLRSRSPVRNRQEHALSSQHAEQPEQPVSDDPPTQLEAQEDHVTGEAVVHQEQLPTPSGRDSDPTEKRLKVLEEMLQAQNKRFDTFLFGAHQSPPVATLEEGGSLPAAAAGVPPLVPSVPLHLAVETSASPKTGLPTPAPATSQLALPQDVLISAGTQDPILDAILAHTKPGGETFNASVLNLGTFLSDSIHKQIKSKEYVHFSALMTDPLVSTLSSNFNVDWVNDKPSVSFVKPRAEEPKSFTQWVGLFNIFASVYTEQFPSEAPALFTYSTRIQELTLEGGYIWRDYDDLFRKVKAKMPALPWQETSTRLLSMVHQKSKSAHPHINRSQTNNYRPIVQNHSNPSTVPNHSNSPQTNRPFLPKDSCHSYYLTGQCKRNNCKFSHLCGYCQSPSHSINLCRKRLLKNPNPSKQS